jgi:hypothetical protein
MQIVTNRDDVGILLWGSIWPPAWEVMSHDAQTISLPRLRQFGKSPLASQERSRKISSSTAVDSPRSLRSMLPEKSRSHLHSCGTGQMGAAGES